MDKPGIGVLGLRPAALNVGGAAAGRAPEAWEG